jgi:hypothetical protein
MHVIRPDASFNHFAMKLLRKRHDTTVDFLSYFACDYPVPVLGSPDDMILAMPNGL